MIHPYNTPFDNTRLDSTQSVSPNPQQPAEIGQSDPSTAHLFGLGLVLIGMILLSQQLAIGLHKQYQLNRLAVSLQRRAALERQLRCKSSSKPASRPASRKNLSRQP